MKITVNATELMLEVQRSEKLKPEMRKRVKLRLHIVSTSLMTEVKKRMPVDTGRARASWGKFTPHTIIRFDPANPINPGDAIWIVNDDGMEIIQGTHVPYVAQLNEGSSRQAPAGFIDAISVKEARALAEGVAEDVEGVLSGDNSP